MIKLPLAVSNLIDLYLENGYLAYIVGGAVRDMLLGREVKEYDFAVTATVEQSLKFLVYDTIDLYQQKLGTIKIKQGNNEFEITTMRIEMGVQNGRYPENIEFTTDLYLDALRRDFTINAIYYHPKLGIIDPLNGLKDLQSGIIKFIKNASQSIAEDPIRIIRALRFSQMLGFKIDDDDFIAMTKLAYMVNQLKQIKYRELYAIFKLKMFNISLKNHYSLYLDSYPSINHRLLTSIINNQQAFSQYTMFLLFPKEQVYSFMYNLKLTKKELKLIKNLIDYEKINPSLINVKHQLQNNDDLPIILKIIKPFDEAYYQKMSYYLNEIQLNHLCVKQEDLVISSKDLLSIGIPSSQINCIMRYLLELVMEDDTLNQRNYLLNIAKKEVS